MYVCKISNLFIVTTTLPLLRVQRVHSKYPKISFQKIKTSKNFHSTYQNYNYRLHQPFVHNNKSQKLKEFKTYEGWKTYEVSKFMLTFKYQKVQANAASIIIQIIQYTMIYTIKENAI